MCEHLFPLIGVEPGRQTRLARDILKELTDQEVNLVEPPTVTTNADGIRFLQIIFRSDDDLERLVPLVNLRLQRSP